MNTMFLFPRTGRREEKKRESPPHPPLDELRGRLEVISDMDIRMGMEMGMG